MAGSWADIRSDVAQASAREGSLDEARCESRREAAVWLGKSLGGTTAS